MNIIQTVKPAVVAFAASAGGKAVMKVGKNIGSAVLNGVNVGGVIGGFCLGVKIGHRAMTKTMPAVMKPFIEALDKMQSDIPEFTVTFHKAEQTKDEQNEQEVKVEEVPEKEEQK